MNRNVRHVNAFTIVELLVVIVVIGILVTITIVSYNGIQSRATVSMLQADLKNASTILELDKIDNDSYPATKELAGKGLGLKSNNTLAYTFYSSTNDYCLSATSSNGTVYHISSIKKIPELGICPSDTFVALAGGAGGDEVRSALRISDGSYVLAGTANGFGSGADDALLSKYDSMGNLLWSRIWGGSNLDYASSIKQTSDSGFVTVGATYSFSSSVDAFINKFSSDGNLIWSKTFGGSNNDYAKSVIQLSDGSYLVAGETASYSVPTDNDAFLSRIDSDGLILWTRTLATANTESLGGITQIDDTSCVVSFTTNGTGAGNNDVVIAKYLIDGTFQWSRSWGGNLSDTASSIYRTNDGGFIVAGDTHNGTAGNNDILIVKFNTSGVVVWAKTWGGSGFDYASSVYVDNNQNVLVTGYTTSFGAGDSDSFLLKIDNSQNVSYAKTLGGVGSDYGWFVSGSAGGYFVSGATASFNAAGNDLFLASFNTDGVIDNCTVSNCKNITTGTISSPNFVSINNPLTSTNRSVASSSPAYITSAPSLTSVIVVAR